VGPTGAIQLSGGTNVTFSPTFLHTIQAILMPGSVTVTMGSAALSGVSTNFLFLSPGDQLLLSGYGSVVVLSIQSQTALTLSAPVVNFVASAAFSAVKPVLQFDAVWSFPATPSTPGTMVLAGYMGPFIANGSPYYLPAYQLN
jgi:hypothetical protein